jgi:hypothetical protein
MGQRLIPIAWLLVQEKPQEPRKPHRLKPINQLDRTVDAARAA